MVWGRKTCDSCGILRHMKSRWAARHARLPTLCLLMSSRALSASIHSPTNMVRDKTGLALNQKRLSVAVDDLNAVAEPSHTHEEAGSILRLLGGERRSLRARSESSVDPDSTRSRRHRPDFRRRRTTAANLPRSAGDGIDRGTTDCTWMARQATGPAHQARHLRHQPAPHLPRPPGLPWDAGIQR